MTEQEYMREQARLRTIAYNEALPAQEREAAKKNLEALVERYRKEYPPIVGTFTYTQEEVEEAKRHGF